MAGKSKARGFIELPAAGLTVGGFGAAFLVGIAPYIGLGKDEAFVFYELVGWTRTLVFYTALQAAAVGAVVLVALKTYRFISASVASERWKQRVSIAASSVRCRLSPRNLAVYTSIVCASRIIFLAGFMVAIALFYLGAEIVYRYVVYARAADNATIGSLVGYTVMPVVYEGMNEVPGVADSRPEYGFYPPNTDITMWSYVFKDRLIDFHRAANLPLNPAVTACTDPCRILHATYHSNNFGLLSWRDFKLEKDPDEFRIVVLGQEQTAVATANVSWPDHLEDILNADQELRRNVGKKFTVLNFGWIDGSFGHWSEAWEKKAKFFNPDLIIINYLEFDFYRPKEQPKNVLRGQPVDYYPYTFFINDDPRDWVTAILICNRPGVSLRDPNCSVGLSLAAAMSRSVGDDPEKVGLAIKRLRDEFISGVIWSTWKPLLALSFFGEKVDPFAYRQLEFAAGAPQRNEEVMVEYAREHLRKIINDHKDTIIIHSVYYSEFFAGISDQPVEPPPEFPLTKKLLELDPDLRIVDMREYIPFHLGGKTAATWYHHPYGLEKWTDEGTKVYAKAVAEALRVRWLQRPNIK